MRYCPIYDVHEGMPYGPKWKGRRPPGLPEWARLCSTKGQALPLVHRVSTGIHGEHFARAMERLCRNETGGRIGLPAIRFDARPEHHRPPGRSLITAWGCWQYNRPAWEALTGRDWAPWESTTFEEIALPIQLAYAPVWEAALSAGASAYYAERAVRLHHMAPAYDDDLLRTARAYGWDTAWRRVGDAHELSSGETVRERIERRLSR